MRAGSSRTSARWSGLETETGLGGDRRGEAFAAWRRFLEALAEQRPLVLVLEDLHWADDGLLDFVDELVDWLSGVPLLVVCSAQARAPRAPARLGRREAQRLDDRPLAALAGPDRPPHLARARALAAAGRDPAGAARARRRATRSTRSSSRSSTSSAARRTTCRFPETLQGIVAARLDGLSADEKAVLQDASVVGKVFWTGALRRDEAEATPLLHSLERKGFLDPPAPLLGRERGRVGIRPHAPARRRLRADPPCRARARSIARRPSGSRASDGSEDHAELLAFHWSSALELAQAAGQATEHLETPDAPRLRAAGDRAFAVNAYPAAAAYYDDALALWPNDLDRPLLLFKLADALYRTGDARRQQALEEARGALIAASDQEHAAEAEILLARTMWEQGQGMAGADAYLVGAEELAGTGAPSAAKARVLALAARLRVVGDELDAGLRVAGRRSQDRRAARSRRAQGGCPRHDRSREGPARRHHGDR